MTEKKLPVNAIDIEDLSKKYKSPDGKSSFFALDSVSLNIPRGSIFGLLGPNGAGKSTFINILAGLTIKTSGKAMVWGYDIDKNPRTTRSYLGVVPQELNIDPFFTPKETLNLQAGLYGIRPKERNIQEILRVLDLEDKADAYARELSGGMRRRLLVAKAMVHRPPILILDEPYTGLDQNSFRWFQEFLREFHLQGGTVLMVTHQLELGLKLATRVMVLHRQTIRHDISAAGLSMEQCSAWLEE